MDGHGDNDDRGDARAHANAPYAPAPPMAPEAQAPPAPAAPDRHPEAGAQVLRARFDGGLCFNCGAMIVAQEPIRRWGQAAPWEHVVCPPVVAAVPFRTLGVQGPVHFTWHAADSRFQAANNGFRRAGEVTRED